MTETPNADERDFWSGPTGQSWVDGQQEMDTQLFEVAKLVMDTAKINTDQRVLDIGAGTGALSLMAADAVGPTGRVLATDVSEPMLGLSIKRGQDFSQMDTFLGDAQIANWPESNFDHAISRFGVMFFADPPAAFANIAQALKPGGRITFAAWAPAAKNPFWSIPTKHAVARLGQPPKTEPNTPGPMGLCDMDLALDRLRQAGLGNVTGTETTVHLRHTEGPEAFANLCTRMGSAKRVIMHFDASETDQRAIQDAITADFAQFAQPDGSTAIPAAINLLTAQKPT